MPFEVCKLLIYLFLKEICLFCRREFFLNFKLILISTFLSSLFPSLLPPTPGEYTKYQFSLFQSFFESKMNHFEFWKTFLYFNLSLFFLFLDVFWGVSLISLNLNEQINICEGSLNKTITRRRENHHGFLTNRAFR